jgi:hypothetical protein
LLTPRKTVSEQKKRWPKTAHLLLELLLGFSAISLAWGGLPSSSLPSGEGCRALEKREWRKKNGQNQLTVSRWSSVAASSGLAWGGINERAQVLKSALRLAGAIVVDGGGNVKLWNEDRWRNGLGKPQSTRSRDRNADASIATKWLQ